MEPQVIKATELRTRTREIMERVKYKGECFLVETFGQPMAVIVSVEEFNRILSHYQKNETPAVPVGQTR